MLLVSSSLKTDNLVGLCDDVVDDVGIVNPVAMAIDIDKIISFMIGVPIYCLDIMLHARSCTYDSCDVCAECAMIHQLLSSIVIQADT